LAAVLCHGAALRGAMESVLEMGRTLRHTNNIFLRCGRAKDAMDTEYMLARVSEARDAMELAATEHRKADGNGNELTFAQIAARLAKTHSEQEVLQYGSSG